MTLIDWYVIIMFVDNISSLRLPYRIILLVIREVQVTK